MSQKHTHIYIYIYREICKYHESAKARYSSGVLENFKFMEANFVERIVHRSWRHQFFETKPMGITEKNYELNFAKKWSGLWLKIRSWAIFDKSIIFTQKIVRGGPYYETGSFLAEHSDFWVHDAPRK